MDIKSMDENVKADNGMYVENGTTYYWCRPIDAGHIDADHIDAGHYSCPWSTFDATHV